MQVRRVGRPAGLVQVVRDEIERLIVAGKLEPGSRLPTEKELAERLGVGRSSVREALRALAEMGIVEVVQGKGTFVRNEPYKAIKAQLQFLVNFEDEAYEDLTELRRLLEVGLVRLATQRATTDDLKELQDSLAEMAQAADTERLVEAGARFHQGVAAAAKNPFATALYAAVTQVINEVYRHLERSQAQKERSIRDHQGIYEAIVRRDEDLAAQRVEAHLTHLHGDLIARLETTKQPGEAE